MTPIVALAAAGGIYLLARPKKEAPTAAAPEQQNDIHATLTGPDGAQSTATSGGPVTAYPVVGSGGATGNYQTAATPVMAPPAPPITGGSWWANLMPTGKSTGTSRPLTQTLQPKVALKRTCGSCSETQTNIRSALQGIAPDLRF